MRNSETINELGKYKLNIQKALYQSNDINDLILGDVSFKSAAEKRKLFKKHVKSHLFIDDAITETESFIFYDVSIPRIATNTKACELLLYAVCHRDILDTYDKEGYYGNRADILASMVEECLICDEETSRKFGIGRLNLDSVGVFNGRTIYGRILRFSVPGFR